MSDIHIRLAGQAGRITLQRPEALNAITYEMCSAIEDALERWRDDPLVKLIVIDALGDRAFCAGGDIADLYATGTAGDFGFGQTFWADEYRLNALIASYPKPYVAFMQGFTMGGGVGISCHGSHRIVGRSSQIAMPECGIGLVPDVGGSHILANAPGNLGAYLGLTTARMSAADAIYIGFADAFIPEENWEEAKESLEASGEVETLLRFYNTAPPGALRATRSHIDAWFEGTDLAEIVARLKAASEAEAERALSMLSRSSPLSLACTLHILHHLKISRADLSEALTWEYRFTARSMEHGDFLEGIRAAIIDKDRAPKWKHQLTNVPQEAISSMLASLEQGELNIGRERK